MTVLQLAIVLLVAFGVSVVSIPVIRRFAARRGLFDHPDNDRRHHRTPVPRLGGVGVFLGFIAAITLASTFAIDSDPDARRHTVQLIVSCAILVVIGLADDIRGVRPAGKIAAQTVAALVVQYKWVVISSISLPPNIIIPLGWLAVPLTVLWFVGVSNALNLVDGLDGLAGGVALIAITTLVASSLALGNGTSLVPALALAGGLLGFLRHNFPPARIFLGDSGSLVVGFLLALLAVQHTSRPGGSVVVLLALFALSYPLLDTGIAILRRFLRGDPFSRADGRHVHHQLLALGLSDRRAVLTIYIYAVTVGALGLSVTFAPPAFNVAAASMGVAVLGLGFIYGVRWLDYHEFADAGLILASAGSLARGAIRDSIQARDIARLLERATSLDEIDIILERHATTFNFEHIQVAPLNAVTPPRLFGKLGNIWRLEYPIPYAEVRPAPRGEHPLVLSIWCTKSARVRATNAERVARVLAGAIADWSKKAPGRVDGELLMRSQTPPSFRTLN